MRTVTRICAAAALAAVFVLTIGSATAGAQSDEECIFDGDLDSYLECVLGEGVENTGDGDGEVAASDATLARTGSDVGSMVGIGSALVILGGAAVYGVRQRRNATAS